MNPPYFPNPSPYYLALLTIGLTGFMTAAAWIDWKTWRIPKPLTLGMFATGIVLQMVGGCWMLAREQPGWLFTGNIALGILDGLLFSLAGALSGFGIFFGLWILGIAGGGDVKHATALGAWLGPKCLIGVLFCTVPVVAVILICSIGKAILTQGRIGQTASGKAGGGPGRIGQAAPRKAGGGPGKNRLLSFSLPLALATMLFFVAMFRVPLGLSTQ
jgi:prepilin peptidase CpaA